MACCDDTYMYISNDKIQFGMPYGPLLYQSGMLWYELDFVMVSTFNINDANFERVTKITFLSNQLH